MIIFLRRLERKGEKSYCRPQFFTFLEGMVPWNNPSWILSNVGEAYSAQIHGDSYSGSNKSKQAVFFFLHP